MRLIWASRGRAWGFCFLRDGGVASPFEVYQTAFADTSDSATLFRRLDGLSAVRFPDPQGRTDRAGRVIPHEFVVLDGGGDIETLEEARKILWPAVAADFDAMWDQAGPPPDAKR